MEIKPTINKKPEQQTAEVIAKNEKEKIWSIIKTIQKKYLKEGEYMDSAVLATQVDGWVKAFKGLDNLKGKRILDLGCGANSGSVEIDYAEKDDFLCGDKSFAPWLCRFLLEAGAKPVGIDIGDLDGEEFEHYKADLSQKGALNFLPDKYFDGINCKLLFSSPHLERMVSREQIEKMKAELKKETDRLLKDNGKFILIEEN